MITVFDADPSLLPSGGPEKRAEYFKTPEKLRDHKTVMVI